jgi:hypothetical protein
MPREDGLYYTLVQCNLDRQSVPTEDGLHLSIDCMYLVKEFDNLYIGKMGCAAS